MTLKKKIKNVFSFFQIIASNKPPNQILWQKTIFKTKIKFEKSKFELFYFAKLYYSVYYAIRYVASQLILSYSVFYGWCDISPYFTYCTILISYHNTNTIIRIRQRLDIQPRKLTWKGQDFARRLSWIFKIFVFLDSWRFKNSVPIDPKTPKNHFITTQTLFTILKSPLSNFSWSFIIGRLWRECDFWKWNWF